jgi:hypothetical protein
VKVWWDKMLLFKPTNLQPKEKAALLLSKWVVAVNNLDLIVFLPITKENAIEYTEENPAYRKLADKFFKKIYRDEVCDIFPRYGHPKMIELWGERSTKLKNLESYLI